MLTFVSFLFFPFRKSARIDRNSSFQNTFRPEYRPKYAVKHFMWYRLSECISVSWSIVVLFIYISIIRIHWLVFRDSRVHFLTWIRAFSYQIEGYYHYRQFNGIILMPSSLFVIWFACTKYQLYGYGRSFDMLHNDFMHASTKSHGFFALYVNGSVNFLCHDRDFHFNFPVLHIGYDISAWIYDLNVASNVLVVPNPIEFALAFANFHIVSIRMALKS